LIPLDDTPTQAENKGKRQVCGRVREDPWCMRDLDRVFSTGIEIDVVHTYSML
jgi:hypothetical protein